VQVVKFSYPQLFPSLAHAIACWWCIMQSRLNFDQLKFSEKIMFW